jgi:DNA-3-methyladenine glycosylase II
VATVPVAGPVDLAGSLDVFRRSGDDLLDRWDGQVWLRAVPVGDRLVGVAARPTGTITDPALLVAVEPGTDDPGDPAPLVTADAAAVGRVLAGAFPAAPAALASLAADDPVVARIAARFPGVGPVLQPDLLTAVVRSISAQQITLRFAAVLRARLARRYGRRHQVPLPPAGLPGPAEVWSLDPERLAAAEAAGLRELQFSTSKAAAIVAFAGAVASRRIGLGELAALDDEAVVERLVAFPGIGRWTAEWLLARTLGRPRVVAGDLGVRKAVAAAYLDGRMPSEAEVRAVTAHWGAAAGVAQQLLLHWLYVEAPATSRRNATRPGRSSRPG